MNYKLLSIFENITNFYTPAFNYNIMGEASDKNIGEYVQLYFNVENNIILNACFSAMGDVTLISVAEYLCSIAKGLDFKELLSYCDHNSGLMKELEIDNDRIHSVNLVIYAYYKALEKMVNNDITG